MTRYRRQRLTFQRLESRRLLTAEIDLVLPPAEPADSGAEQPPPIASLAIRQADGLRGAAIELQYDPQLWSIDPNQIQPGSVWGGRALAVANVDPQAGTIGLFLFSAREVPSPEGSLVDLVFQREQGNTGDEAPELAINQLRFNDGGLAWQFGPGTIKPPPTAADYSGETPPSPPTSGPLPLPPPVEPPADDPLPADPLPADQPADEQPAADTRISTHSVRASAAGSLAAGSWAAAPAAAVSSTMVTRPTAAALPVAGTLPAVGIVPPETVDAAFGQLFVAAGAAGAAGAGSVNSSADSLGDSLGNSLGDSAVDACFPEPWAQRRGSSWRMAAAEATEPAYGPQPLAVESANGHAVYRRAS